jgi:hypothetical protein
MYCVTSVFDTVTGVRQTEHRRIMLGSFTSRSKARSCVNTLFLHRVLRQHAVLHFLS